MKIIQSLRQRLKATEMFNNTFLSLFSKAIAMVLFLITDVVIARFLAKNGNYGEWTFYYAIVSMCFWVVWFGINPSTKVFVAKEVDNPSHQQDYLMAGGKLRVIVSLLFFILFLVAGFFLAEPLGYPQKYPHLRALFFSGAFLCFFNSFSEFFKEINIGLVKFKNIFWISVIEFGGNFIIGAGLLLLTRSVLGLAWGYVLASIITAGTGLTLLIKIYSKKKVEQDKIYQKHAMQKIFHYALPIFLVNIGAMILTEIDVFMLGIMRDPIENGLYTIAKGLCGKATHVNLAISTSTMTAFAVITKKNVREKKKLYQKIVSINFILSVIIAIVLFLCGPWAVQILYGEQYILAGNILQMMVPYYLFFSITLFSGALLDYQQKAKQRMISYIVMVVLDVVLNYLFIPLWGAAGAAVATCLSMVPYVVSLEVLAKKIFSLKVKEL